MRLDESVHKIIWRINFHLDFSKPMHYSNKKVLTVAKIQSSSYSHKEF